MITTIYLIRHSVKLSNKLIESYNSKESNLIKSEKVILSSDGEERAKILCSELELQNIDKVYTSNCVRTLQTAKYMLVNQDLNVNIDDRLDERRVGIPNDDSVKNWFEMQYMDENYKTVGGESQKEVRQRMSEVLDEVLKENEGKRIAIFTHGYAITFLLLKWCKLISIKNDGKGYILHYKYNDKTLFNKKINSPDVFKLTYKNNKLINIENIIFDDLPYEDVLTK